MPDAVAHGPSPDRRAHPPDGARRRRPPRRVPRPPVGRVDPQPLLRRAPSSCLRRRSSTSPTSTAETGWPSSPPRARRSSGVGRLERLPGTTDAEVAFVVADDHQRQGLGTRLLERLERAARPLGVTHFVADTLFSNTAMLHVLRQPARLVRAGRGRRGPRAVPDRGSAFGARARDLRLLCSGGQIRTFDIDLNAQEHTMTTITRDPVVTTTDTRPTPVEPTVALKRRTIDTVFVGVGVVLVVVLVVAGGLLTWGANFSKDYVNDELSLPEHRLPAGRRPRGRGSHRPAAVRRRTPSTPAPRPRPTPASSTATSKASPTAPPTPTSATPSGRPTPPSRRRPPTAPAPPRSPSCRAKPTPSAASATPSSRVRPSGACCSAPSPGRPSAASPASPPSPPSQRPA